ncbi:hypothetical protein ONA24_01170 [Mycoplasmopsis cynos]|uniref:hypothetical protein n=1 Tax=Mycoplasmopsis cynos TaxID=171284 RepID=UPI0024C891FB|nr:hypothetical protein [Mycoplasmopsis cynos]WAM09935.1 hypothetical protein ONA24_01170 [Mycoplasmopsis cynos]
MSYSLATNAVKTGIVAAFHLAGSEAIPFPGYSGTNAISVFDFNYASTGLTETMVKNMIISKKILLLNISKIMIDLNLWNIIIKYGSKLFMIKQP